MTKLKNHLIYKLLNLNNITNFDYFDMYNYGDIRIELYHVAGVIDIVDFSIFEETKDILYKIKKRI